MIRHSGDMPVLITWRFGCCSVCDNLSKSLSIINRVFSYQAIVVFAHVRVACIEPLKEYLSQVIFGGGVMASAICKYALWF